MVDALGHAGAGVADQIGDVLARQAVGGEHAHERVPQLAGRPLLPQACVIADCLEVAAHVPGAARRANGAGEDQIALFPSRPSSHPLGGLPGPVLSERVGDELGHCQRALTPLGLGAVSAWLDSLDLDPSTVANYRFMAKHVTSGLGDRRLRDLTPKDVQAFLEALPLSTRSRKLVHKILRDSIQHAMIAGLAGRNVAATVNATPRGSGGTPSKALSVAQAEAVLNAAKGTRLEAYLALSLMTGIRTEEARALTWEHVDLDGDPAADPPVPPHVAVWRSVSTGALSGRVRRQDSN